MLQLAGRGKLEFSNFLFWGEVKIFDFRGCQFILSPFSRFEMQDFKNSKMFACDALIFNIHIFRFKMNAGLEVDIDLKHWI